MKKLSVDRVKCMVNPVGIRLTLSSKKFIFLADVAENDDRLKVAQSWINFYKKYMECKVDFTDIDFDVLTRYDQIAFRTKGKNYLLLSKDDKLDVVDDYADEEDLR